MRTSRTLAATTTTGFAVEIVDAIARVRELVMLLGTNTSNRTLFDRLADELSHPPSSSPSPSTPTACTVNMVNSQSSTTPVR